MAELHTKTDTETLPTTRELVEENAQLKAENQWLKEQLGLAKHRLCDNLQSGRDGQGERVRRLTSCDIPG